MNTLIGLLCLTSPWLVDLGAGKPALEKVSRELEQARWLETRAPQALRIGLIDSKMLETMNFYEMTTKSEGAFAAGAIGTIFIGQRQGRKYTYILGPGGTVTYILVRIPVPVDKSADPQNGWSRERLGALDRALDELGSIFPVGKDPRGNVFQWKKQVTRGELRARYLPEDDELRIFLWSHQ